MKSVGPVGCRFLGSSSSKSKELNGALENAGYLTFQNCSSKNAAGGGTLVESKGRAGNPYVSTRGYRVQHGPTNYEPPGP